jgi:hypothetical protein
LALVGAGEYADLTHDLQTLEEQAQQNSAGRHTVEPVVLNY